MDGIDACCTSEEYLEQVQKNARSIFLNGTCVLYKWHIFDKRAMRFFTVFL